jgi:hypothetical protein
MGGVVANGVLRSCDRLRVPHTTSVRIIASRSHLVPPMSRPGLNLRLGRAETRLEPSTRTAVSFVLVACLRVLALSQAPTTVPCGLLKHATDWHACRNLSLAPALSPNQGSGHVDAAHERPREQLSISFFYHPSIRLLEGCHFRSPRCTFA